MNILVLYSSTTGNTEKVANAIYEALDGNKSIKKIDENVDFLDYDIIFLGYWVDKGTCDSKSKKLFEKIHNKKVSVFGTMGAAISEDYTDKIIKNIISILPSDNQIVGTFMCQGKIAEYLKQKYIDMLKDKPDNEHILNQLKNYEKAQSHPDSTDLKNAKLFAKSIVEQILQ